jgi:hypothetical protein
VAEDFRGPRLFPRVSEGRRDELGDSGFRQSFDFAGDRVLVADHGHILWRLPLAACTLSA